MFENLIKCHPYYRGLSKLWERTKVDPRDRRCRIANRAMRMVYQLVGGRHLWRGKGVDREYLLKKLEEFHRVHQTPMDQTIRDLHEAFVWVPRSAYAEEAKPLEALARRRRRGPRAIGELLVPLLIKPPVARTILPPLYTIADAWGASRRRRQLTRAAIQQPQRELPCGHTAGASHLAPSRIAARP